LLLEVPAQPLRVVIQADEDEGDRVVRLVPLERALDVR
jgi:hypothetical protein